MCWSNSCMWCNFLCDWLWSFFGSMMCYLCSNIDVYKLCLLGIVDLIDARVDWSFIHLQIIKGFLCYHKTLSQIALGGATCHLKKAPRMMYCCPFVKVVVYLLKSTILHIPLVFAWFGTVIYLTMSWEH